MHFGYYGDRSSTKYDDARPTTLSTGQTTHIDYVGQANTPKAQKYLYDQARPTTKDTTHVEGYVGLVGEPKAQKYLYDAARPTSKQTTHVGYVGYVGEPKAQKYLYDAARPTSKQTTHVEGYVGGSDLYGEKSGVNQKCSGVVDETKNFTSYYMMMKGQTIDELRVSPSSCYPGRVNENDKKYKIIETLTDCYFVSDKLLSSKTNCVLLVDGGIEVNELVEVRDPKFAGIYKVISIGSSTMPWVLEKCHKI
jgi:hypothetical protein